MSARLFHFSQFRRFGLLALRSRFIGQPLAFDAEQRAFGASSVVNAEFDAIGVAEIELGEIAVKVLFAAMLIDADHAALEDAEIALDGVGVDLRAGLAVGVAVFAARMVNRVMLAQSHCQAWHSVRLHRS